MNKKSTIIGIIAGIIIAAVAYYAYTVYQLKAIVVQDDEVLHQVVNFINQGIQAQQNAASSTKK